MSRIYDRKVIFIVHKDQIQTLESFEMEIFNNGLADETNVTAFVEITEPNGTVSTISESVGTVVSGTAPIELEFTGTYTPPAVTGRYTVKYSLTSDQGSYSGDTVLQYFDITDDIYRNDDNMGSITVPNPGTNFLTRYDIGNMYYPSSNAVAICIGETTGTEAKNHFDNVVISKVSTVESMLKSVNVHFEEIED